MKRQRTEAEVAVAMSRRDRARTADESMVNPSPGRRVLRSSRDQARGAAASSKKKRAATPPRREGGVNIRDSPPRKQHRPYVVESECSIEVGDIGNIGAEDIGPGNFL